jgi:hypothetical protein
MEKLNFKPVEKSSGTLLVKSPMRYSSGLSVQCTVVQHLADLVVLLGPRQNQRGEAKGASREDEGLRQAAPEHAGVRRRLQG